MEDKITLVVGASENENRYSNFAIKRLLSHGHKVLAVGNRVGEVDGVKIEKDFPTETIDTVTLYVSARNQEGVIPEILKLKPRRVIFNPGTENIDFEKELQYQGIASERACTLVMLSSGTY